MHNNTVYEWILQQFTVSAREKSLQRVIPYLSALVQPGDNVLDLCCGSGPATFFFEEQECTVTGIDFAPYMIALAKGEALLRESSAQFVEADIFTYDLEKEQNNLISCLGNSINDFPLSDFARLANLVFKALKPQGHFVIEYHDASYEYMRRRVAYEGVYQESPERITYQFKEYLPEIGAYVKTISNETSGDKYDRMGYIYTVPVVQVTMGNSLALEGHHILGENHFLDIFVK